jgi:hypothetical protein
MPTVIIRRLTARDTRLSSFRYYDLLVHIFVVILLISLTYLIVNKLKRAEGIDVYDRGTNFNPFARSREIVPPVGIGA